MHPKVRTSNSQVEISDSFMGLFLEISGLSENARTFRLEELTAYMSNVVPGTQSSKFSAKVATSVHSNKVSICVDRNTDQVSGFSDSLEFRCVLRLYEYWGDNCPI